MPDLEFPPEFRAMSRNLRSAFNLDFVTEIGQAWLGVALAGSGS